MVDLVCLLPLSVFSVFSVVNRISSYVLSLVAPDCETGRSAQRSGFDNGQSDCRILVEIADNADPTP